MSLVDCVYYEQGSYENYEIHFGDLLIAMSGATTGKTAIYRDQAKAYLNQRVGRFKPIAEIHYPLLYSIVNSPAFRNQLNSKLIAGAQPNISSSDIESIKCYIPHIDEQIKIATLMQEIDKRIAIQNKIIEQYKSLIRALYARMLGKMGGEKYALGQLVTIRKGQQVNGEFLAESGTYKVLNGGINPSGYLEEYNTPSGTISISEGGNSCGYVQFNSEPFWSGGHCYILESNDEMVNYLFLYHYLKFKQADIMALRIGSGLPNIQKKDLEKFEVIIPDTQYQNKATSIFSVLSEKMELEQYMLGVMNEQKAYLLRQLFI